MAACRLAAWLVQNLGLSEKPYVEDAEGQEHGVMEHADDAISVSSNGP